MLLWCNLHDLRIAVIWEAYMDLQPRHPRDECETPWQCECQPTFGWHCWRAKISNIHGPKWTLLPYIMYQWYLKCLKHVEKENTKVGRVCWNRAHQRTESPCFQSETSFYHLSGLGSLFGPRPKNASNKPISTCHRCSGAPQSTINSNHHQQISTKKSWHGFARKSVRLKGHDLT